METLWNEERPVTDFDIDVPPWIDADISPYDVAAIVQGGCASGAYMPAVTYHEAVATMSKHGDAVTEYIVDVYGELPAPRDHSKGYPITDWSSIAVFYLSMAVELWAMSVADRLEEVLAA